MEAVPEKPLDRLCSLPDLHALLTKYYDDVPSIATLKRWSSAGTLNEAKRTHRGAPSRDPFHAGDALKIIQQLGRAREKASAAGQAPHAAAVPGTHGSEASPPWVPAFAEELVKQFLAKLPTPAAGAPSPGPGMQDLMKAVTQLDGLRATLMTKYDAAYTQQGAVIEALRTRLQDGPALDNLMREVSALKIITSNLRDAMTDRSAADRMRQSLQHLAVNAGTQEDREYARKALADS